jgi:mannose-6-phosphate isomerase-like protein (cupin superfamily)
MEEPYQLQPLEGRPSFWFLGGRVHVKVPGEHTDGHLSQLEFDDRLGQAPPLHVHDGEDEVWFVLDGKITFFVGDRSFDLEAGAMAFGPRGVPHSYLVRSSRSRMLVSYGPAGLERWFTENGSPIAAIDDAPAAFDIGAIISSAERYGLRVIGPPPALQ